MDSPESQQQNPSNNVDEDILFHVDEDNSAQPDKTLLANKRNLKIDDACSDIPLDLPEKHDQAASTTPNDPKDSKDDVNIKCRYCTKSFKYKKNLYAHIRSSHPN